MACDDCPKGLDRILHGAAGLAKATGHLVGLNAVPNDVLLSRVRACLGDGPRQARCEYAGSGWFCGKCGCLIGAKLRVKSERCPAGKWESVE